MEMREMLIYLSCHAPNQISHHGPKTIGAPGKPSLKFVCKINNNERQLIRDLFHYVLHFTAIEFETKLSCWKLQVLIEMCPTDSCWSQKLIAHCMQ